MDTDAGSFEGDTSFLHVAAGRSTTQHEPTDAELEELFMAYPATDVLDRGGVGGLEETDAGGDPAELSGCEGMRGAEYVSEADTALYAGHGESSTAISSSNLSEPLRSNTPTHPQKTARTKARASRRAIPRDSAVVPRSRINRPIRLSSYMRWLTDIKVCITKSSKIGHTDDDFVKLERLCREVKAHRAKVITDSGGNSDDTPKDVMARATMESYVLDASPETTWTWTRLARKEIDWDSIQELKNVGRPQNDLLTLDEQTEMAGIQQSATFQPWEKLYEATMLRRRSAAARRKRNVHDGNDEPALGTA